MKSPCAVPSRLPSAQSSTLRHCRKRSCRPRGRPERIHGHFDSPGTSVFRLRPEVFCVDQAIGVAGPAGVFCSATMELAGSKDLLFIWVAGSEVHSDVDVKGPAIGFSGFLGRDSWSLPNISFWLFMKSSSMIACGNLGGRMMDCCRWLLLLEVYEKMGIEKCEKTMARLEKNEKKAWKKFVHVSAWVSLDSNSLMKIYDKSVECLR